MTGKVKLDNVDRQILHDLQDDGRITNVELAKRAGISAPPCLRRVRVLEDAGIIKGYHADIDADLLGYSVNVFAFVGLTSQAETDLQEFEEMVSAWPQVRECHMLMGETDFVLKIVAPRAECLPCENRPVDPLRQTPPRRPDRRDEPGGISRGLLGECRQPCECCIYNPGQF